MIGIGVPLSVLVPLGSAAAVVLIGLYLLRERHRPVVVPFLDLFRARADERVPGRLAKRLRRLASLLLQLLVLLLLLLALFDPRSEASRKPGRSIAVLLDVSASMAALVPAPPSGQRQTRLDRAKERVRDWARKLSDSDRLLLIELSARPEPRTSFTNDPRSVEAALDALGVKDVPADLRAGLLLARDALAGLPHPEVIVVGDGAYPPLDSELARGLDVRFEPVVEMPVPSSASREGPENVGISAFSARRYRLDPQRFEVLLDVASTAKSSAEVELTLASVDAAFRERAPLDVHRLDVPPSGQTSLLLQNLSGATEGIVARLRRTDGGDNWLPGDDRAHLLLAPLRPVRVLVVGRDNTFLDAALLTEPGVDLQRVAPEQYPPQGEYDVTVFDGTSAPRSARTGAALYLGAGNGLGFPLELGKKLELFGFDHWRKDSPLFRSVDPYDVQVLQGRALVPRRGDVVLGQSGQEPIIVLGEREEGRFVALGFDPRQSDFVLRPAWPLFLHNVLWHLAPGPDRSDGLARATGTTWHLEAPLPSEPARLVGPLGTASLFTQRLAVSHGHATTFGERAGFYRIEQGREAQGFFANFFDPIEATLLPAPRLFRPNETDHAAKRETPRPDPIRATRQRPPWIWLALAAALISFLEWWTYHRRWTV